MRVMLVTNPKAGRSRGVAAAAQAEDEFRGAGWEVVSRPTTGPTDAAPLARQAAERGFDLVVACGGDGTLSQVLAGLLDTGVPAGIVPAGTGNDLARTLGVSRLPRAAARQLVDGRTVQIDLLEVNDGALWSANVMGVGFDAAVAARISRGGRFAGRALAYLDAVLQEIVRHRPSQLRLRTPGREWQGKALLVAVANGRSYGAGMKIAPQAEVDDGLLDIVLVEEVGRLGFLLNLPRVYAGTHIHHPAVHTWRATEVVIETDRPCPVLADGDLRCETPIRVAVARRRAKLRVPHDSPVGRTASAED